MAQKVVIAGSRGIHDPHMLTVALRGARLHGVITSDTIIVISGGAAGVDTLAKDYAMNNNLGYEEFPPQYKSSNDRGAPLRRNAEMAKAGDVLVAIWDGSSPGTLNMISCMSALNKPVYIHQP